MQYLHKNIYCSTNIRPQRFRKLTGIIKKVPLKKAGTFANTKKKMFPYIIGGFYFKNEIKTS